MKIEFPQSIDPYPVQDDLATREEYQDPNSITQLDLIYSIIEMQKRIGTEDTLGNYRTDNQPAGADTWIADSHEYRLTLIEALEVATKIARLEARIQELEAAAPGTSNTFAIVDTGVSSAGENYTLPASFTLAIGYSVVGRAYIGDEDVGFSFTKGEAAVNIKPFKTGADIDITVTRKI